MRTEPKHLPYLAIEFQFADGGALRRSWTLADFDADNSPPDDAFDALPDWLDNPLKTWAHPMDPVLYSGDVKPGREKEAREFVAGLEAAGQPEGGDE